MSKDTRDLLAVLKAELDFVEKGGYSHTARAAWRPAIHLSRFADLFQFRSRSAAETLQRLHSDADRSAELREEEYRLPLYSAE